MQSIFMLTPVSKEAKEWVEENVRYESYQMLGQGVGVEHRYIGDIIAGMQAEGLELDKDFTVV